MTPREGQHSLGVEQRLKDKFDLVDVVLVSRVGMARNAVHTRLCITLCELTSRVWIKKGREQAHNMPNVRMRSAREATSPAAGRKLIIGN